MRPHEAPKQYIRKERIPCNKQEAKKIIRENLGKRRIDVETVTGEYEITEFTDDPNWVFIDIPTASYQVEHLLKSVNVLYLYPKVVIDE